MNAGNQLNVGLLANGGSLHHLSTRRMRLRWLRRAAFCSCALALLVLAAVWFTSAAQAQQREKTKSGWVVVTTDPVLMCSNLERLIHITLKVSMLEASSHTSPEDVVHMVNQENLGPGTCWIERAPLTFSYQLEVSVAQRVLVQNLPDRKVEASFHRATVMQRGGKHYTAGDGPYFYIRVLFTLARDPDPSLVGKI